MIKKYERMEIKVKKMISILTLVAIILNINVVVLASGEESESERKQRLLAADIAKLEYMIENNFDELVLNAKGGKSVKVSEYTSTRAIGDVDIIKNRCIYPDTQHGAHYYAFSPEADDYVSVSGYFELPTALNNADNTRNAYISVGVYGINHGVDIGIRNGGQGWCPYYYDQSQENKDDVFKTYDDVIVDDTAVCATFIVRPYIKNDEVYILIWICFYDDTNDEALDYLVMALEPGQSNVPIEEDRVNYRFYRFISLVQLEKMVDNQMDGSYMLEAGFSELKISTESMNNAAWGIDTDMIDCAWRISPERITVTYDIDSENCSIDHWAE